MGDGRLMTAGSLRRGCEEGGADGDPKTALDDLWGMKRRRSPISANARMPGDWLLNGTYSAQKNGSPDVTVNVPRATAIWTF